MERVRLEYDEPNLHKIVNVSQHMPGTIMTASIICANLITVVMWLLSVVTKKGIRMSGNHVYDLFMVN